MEKIILDTSAIIEYIIRRSPYRQKLIKIFEKASRGELELYVNTITLSETLYIASRIYQAAGIDDPNVEAQNFIEWIKNKAKVIPIDEEIAVRAGELKKQFHLALPDCTVLATAETVNAKPLFKKQEKEMKPTIGQLRKLGISFLDEIEI